MSVPPAPATQPSSSGASEGVTLLHLVAMDAEDLAIVSAHLQDMQVAIKDIVYAPERKRFALAGKRFDWSKSAAGGCERCAAGLRFDYVLGAAYIGLSKDDGERLLNLLAVNFEPTAEPGGTVLFTFSGGAAIRISVDCLEAQMNDLGERWPCDCIPRHA